MRFDRLSVLVNGVRAVIIALKPPSDQMRLMSKRRCLVHLFVLQFVHVKRSLQYYRRAFMLKQKRCRRRVVQFINNRSLCLRVVVLR